MRVLKLGIISFIFLFLLLTAFSFFIPSQVRITRALQINAAPEAVMKQIEDPTAWKAWFPGTDTSRLYYENGQVLGIIMNEKQNRLIRIVQREPLHLVAEYKGIKQKKVITGWVIHQDPNNKVTVEWYMDMSLRWYPWEKFSSILFEKQYGPQIEQGLDRLKKRVETN